MTAVVFAKDGPLGLDFSFYCLRGSFSQVFNFFVKVNLCWMCAVSDFCVDIPVHQYFVLWAYMCWWYSVVLCYTVQHWAENGGEKRFYF